MTMQYDNHKEDVITYVKYSYIWGSHTDSVFTINKVKQIYCIHNV